ncbi:MAG TPA: hypothetical protein VMD75_13415 [Candidatus Binataceae bacterium]|nr:hypothetical protein [Candidatus Binataceae bacterium]
MERKLSRVSQGGAAIWGGLVMAGLLAIVAQSAAAQETNPMPTVRDYVGAPGAASNSAGSTPPTQPATAKPPKFCKPCRYYSGDFNPADSNANAFSNENDEVVDLAQLYTPFTIPSGQKWQVTGLFVNNLLITAVTPSVLDPVKTGWSIWTGVGTGIPGTLIAAGVSKGKLAPTGRTFASVYTEYTTSVKVSGVTLTCGTYFVNVLPQCTNTEDTSCTGQRYYETDVEDTSPAEHIGPSNLLDQTFWLSNFFTYNYELPEDISLGGDLFSFGVEGNSSAGPKCL